ncbi:MAG TPA: hypothetical protein ENO23_04665, partial [Alphaproteobacteria bacterium]|nr:hypothetical protein [Alphaproteobacteria bacterium]
MTLLSIFTAAWLILSLVAAAAAPGLLWGLAGWRVFSFTGGTVIAAVILAFTLVRQRGAKKAEGAGGKGTPEAAGAGGAGAAAPPLPSRLERAVPWIAAAAFLVIAWVLRARHDLVGEAGAVPGAIAAGTILTKAAPLATLAHALLYRFMNGVFLRTAAEAGMVLSILSGLLYTILAFRLAARVPGDLAGKAVLFASGWAALFFGVPGVGAVSMAAALLFLLLAVDAFYGGHPAPAGLALVLAIGMHTSLACLIPAYLWLLARRTGAGRRHEANVSAMVTMSALVVLLVAVALLEGGGGPLGVALSGLGALTHTSIEATARDGLNALLAGGPVTLLAIVLLVAGIARGRAPRAAGAGTAEIRAAGDAAANDTAARTGGRGDAPRPGLRRFVFWLVAPATIAVLLAAPRVQG